MTVVIITPWEEEKQHQKEQPSERCLIYIKIWSQCESRSVMSNSLWPHGLYSTWNSPDQNMEASSLSFLQGIFPIQGSNLGLLVSCIGRQVLYDQRHLGSPKVPQVILKWREPMIQREGRGTPLAKTEKEYWGRILRRESSDDAQEEHQMMQRNSGWTLPSTHALSGTWQPHWTLPEAWWGRC